MALKPEKFPDWATEEEVDPVSGQVNRVEPPDFRKVSGWTRREIPPRQWLNWLTWKTARWIRWAEERIESLEWNYYDAPVEMFLDTVGSAATFTSPHEFTLNLSDFAGIDNSARYLTVSLSARTADSHGGRVGWRKPSDTNIKWVIGANAEIAGEGEPKEFELTGGREQTLVVPVENGSIVVRVETEAGNATIGVFAIAEMV